MHVTRSVDVWRPAVMAYSITLAAMLVASFFTDVRLWGVSWYGYFGWPGRVFLMAAGLVTVLLLSRLRTKSSSASQLGMSGGRTYGVTVAALLLVFTLAFWFLRGQTHFLGDGYQLLSWLEQGIHFKPWERGTFFVQTWVYDALGRGGADDALVALQIVSIGSGVLLLGSTAIFAARLFKSTSRRLLFVLGVGSAGYMLLYFGYVESYPLFVLSVALFCLTGLLATRGQAGRWWILLPLALAGYFHIFTVALVPAALFVLFSGTRPGRWLASRGTIVKVSLLVLVLAIGAAVFYRFYTTSYFFQFTIVPFVANRFTTDNYTMFSAKHILDYFNHLFQLLPLIFMMVLLLISRKFVQVRQGAEYWFLIVAALGPLGLSFVVNAGLGMPRDWDLFSFAGVPPAIACYYVLLDERLRLRAATSLAGLAVALGLLALLPRVVIQATPDLSIALYDDIRNLDPLRSSGGEFWLHRYLTDHGREREAVRRQQLNVERAQHEILDRQGQALMHQREYLQAIDKFKLAVEKAPIYSNAWTNMGLCYLQIGQTDSALQALKIADAMNPYNFNNLNGLARTYFARDEHVAAETYWLKATDLAPYELGPYDFLLIVYDLQKSDPKLDRLLARLIQSANEPQAPLAFVVGATQTLLRRNRVEYARPLYEKALRLGLDTNLARDLQTRYPALGP